MLTKLFHNLDYKAGCKSHGCLSCSHQFLMFLPVILKVHKRDSEAGDSPDAKGYTRGFEASIGYKKGYAAGEKLAREQAASENAKAQQMP